MQSRPILLIMFCLFSLNSCKYSFTGISIPPDIKTFFVEPFEVSATNAEITLSQTFTDRLKDKILTESRLVYANIDPDCEFSGTIASFDISSIAPQPGETTAFNRLDIMVRVEFVNNKDESQNWRKSFPYFADFPSEQNFLDVQDDLIDDINTQLVEDIFNKAFTNW